MAPRPVPALNRFWRNVVKTDTCWQWAGSKKPDGYGQMWVLDLKRSIPPHRFSYELHCGPIPEGLVIDHLCFNRLCVNPAHLEPVTPRENTLRMLRAGRGGHHVPPLKTVCKWGHPFVPYILRGRRNGCLTCKQERNAARSSSRKSDGGHSLAPPVIHCGERSPGGNADDAPGKEA